ncbi:MAG: endonuclease [Flavobacteriaceae bacterium]
MAFPFFKRKKRKHLFTAAFYNLENLFDTEDDSFSLDDDFTPEGAKKWSNKRYKRKLSKLSKTIDQLGRKESALPPALVGVAEVENKRVVQELLQCGPLKKIPYDYIHFDSPDERGIDTALIYHKEHFKPLFSEPIPLFIENKEGERDMTRDILYVYGMLNGEAVHLFVNHWPSRRAGEELTSSKRLSAADTIISYMSGLEKEHEQLNYIVMGDFNDGPEDRSIKHLVESKDLYNPMEKLITPDRGSANYKRSWSLFDQIIVSHSFFDFKKGTHSFAHANIFDEYFLTEWKGKYRGNPFRTYVGRKYKGGYSDHFPVYIQLKLNTP